MVAILILEEVVSQALRLEQIGIDLLVLVSWSNYSVLTLLLWSSASCGRIIICYIIIEHLRVFRVQCRLTVDRCVRAQSAHMA
jgi:hypothetical protein